MDWKTYEQARAIGAGLKAKREAQATAVQEAKKIAEKAPARPVAAPASVAAAKRAKVPAPPKQTPPSAVPVVTPPKQEATPKSTLDADLRQDLKLEDLYRNVKALPSQLEGQERVNASVRALQEKTGLTPQRYRELAGVQGIDLEDLDKKARSGMPFENYRQAKKDAIGFVPVEQRASMFEDIAKDYAAAEKGEIRTDKRLSLSGAQEAPGTLGAFSTGYVVGATTAEETPEVVKPNEHYYAVAQKYLEAVDKDPEVVKLVNLYGNSLAGGASQKYVNDRTLQLMKNKGITPSSPDADRQASLARRQAMYEVLARKTVGQWTPAVFAKDVQITDDAKQTDNPFAALAPNIELIGFNNKGDAVFRQESPAGVMLRTLDLVGIVPIPGKGKIIPVPIPGQALIAGLATRGEDETYAEAMSRGVQTGANWLELALDETKNLPLPLRAGAGLAGMAAAVVHPDVTAAAGSLNEAQKALRIAYVNKKVAKEAVPILGDLIEAYKAEDFERASELEKKLAASEMLGKRSEKHSIVKAYDRNDAAFAMALASINPALKHTDVFLVDNLIAAVGRRGNDALTEFVYETAGKGAPHLHFAEAAREMAERGKSGETGATFMSFLDSGNFARRKERIQKARDAFVKQIPQTAEEALGKTVDDAVDRIRGRLDGARMMGVPDADLARDQRLADLMQQNKAALIADPSGDTFRDILRADPVTGGDANVTWRAETYKTDLGRTTKRLKNLVEKDYQAVVAADLRLFDDALAAVDTNVKSRMMAAESLRRNLAERANIEITPIDILDEVLEPGTERLSPYAQASFLVTARQFPKEEMDRKELYLAYQALDEAFQGVAERNGVPVEDIWRDFFVRVEEGSQEMPGTAAAKAAGKAPPKPPATLPAVPSDVPKIANVPTSDPKLEAAITEAAKKATRTKAAPQMHPQTGEIVAKLPQLAPEAKATPENVSKILKVVDALGAGAPFPAVPGQTKVLLASVRDQLLESGVLVKLDDGKIVKAGGAAPAPAPVKAVEPAATEISGLAEAQGKLAEVDAQIEETDDLIGRADEVGATDEADRLRNQLGYLERTQEILKKRVESLKAQAPAPKVEAPTPAAAPTPVAASRPDDELFAELNTVASELKQRGLPTPALSEANVRAVIAQGGEPASIARRALETTVQDFTKSLEDARAAEAAVEAAPAEAKAVETAAPAAKIDAEAPAVDRTVRVAPALEDEASLRAYNETVRASEEGTGGISLQRDTVQAGDNIMYRPDRGYRFIGDAGFKDFEATGLVRANQTAKAGYEAPYFMTGKTSGRYAARRGKPEYVVEMPITSEWRGSGDYVHPPADPMRTDKIRVFRREADGSYSVVLDNIGDQALLSPKTAPAEAKAVETAAEAPAKAAKAPRGKKAAAPPAAAPAPVVEAAPAAPVATNEAEARLESLMAVTPGMSELERSAADNLRTAKTKLEAAQDRQGAARRWAVGAEQRTAAQREVRAAEAEFDAAVDARKAAEQAAAPAAPVAAKVEPTPAAAPVVPPAATLENLGNRALWKEVKPKRLTAASTGMLEAKVGNVEFRISTVPAAKEGGPPVFRVMARVGKEFESLGPEAGYASLEDALRALTPTASGPAPLRAQIDNLMRGVVQRTSNKKAKVTPVQAEEIVEEALDEGVPEQVAKLEAEAPAVAVEEAAPAAPKLAPEEMRAKAVDELGKITHSVVKADGTKVYGVVEGDMFVPKYTLAPGEMRDPTDALYFKASRGSMAVDEPRTLKEVGAKPESLQRVVQKIQNMDEGELYQLGVVEAEKGVGRLVTKGKAEFLTPAQIKELAKQDSPTAIITLFRGTADPTTLLHEGAHYIRRMGLDSDDMDAITAWIKTEGVNVNHRFGDFVGSAADVERAEELFAQAFEQYMLKGEAPRPALKVLFEKVKDVFAKVYRTLSKGPLGKEIQPEVKAVFDRLFTRVPDKKPESTFDMLMRQTFNNKGMEQEGGLTVLAREAKRRGMGGKTVEDLAKLMAQAPTTYGPDKWLEAVVIDFPAPVFGKTEWTGADILELSNRVQTRRNDLALSPLKQALFGDPAEETLTESIYTTLIPKKGDTTLTTVTRTVGSALAHSVIGGDIVGERHMRNLLPEVRRSLNTSTRIIEQAIGDTISVLSETIATGDMNFMYRYLAGETGMVYKSGRRVVSSGHEFIAGFMDLFRNAGNSLTSSDRALLQKFAQAINTRPDLVADVARVKPQFRSEALARLVFPDLEEVEAAKAAAKEAGETPRPDIIRATMQQKASELMNAINKFRELKGTDDQGVGSMLAKAMKGATEEGAEPSINEFRFTETLLYLAGITPRDGKFFLVVGDDYSKANLKVAAQTLLDDAQKIYGTAEDQLFARRMSILVGAYGSASRAKAELAELGLVLTKEEAEAYKNWSLAYSVNPEMRPRIEGLMRKLGANTKFEADTILGVDMYVPRQARERIAEALQKAQFSEQRLTKAGDLYQMAFAFIKKRMTRGNLVLRQRYFMVNTIDHFFQMSLIVGYAPAFQSMARVALQNVMASLPGQMFEMIVRGISLVPGAKIDRAIVERLRDKLSEGGDRVAFGLRKMFSDSKYRVEVNHVLEGRNIPIVLGGHVTTGKRLREIMVGEGILESYNTRRLGQVIRQEGTAFLNDGDGIVQAGIDDRKLGGNVTTAWAKIKSAGTDLTFNVVDDIGDAWAERERVGAAVTLIENGYEPRLACRLTVDALYDYAQSMTKGDRSWLVGLMFPFWAFQKNANQQFVNVLATPYGAYRMMVLKRFRDRGSELLTELYYDAVGGELGLDVNQMPQDMQDMYYAIMTRAHEVYGDEIPEDAKLALRMALTGRAAEVIGGKYYELDDSLISMLNAGGVAGVGGAAMSEYMLPRPDKAILPSYMRERPGVFIAQRRNAMVRLYSGLRGKNDEMFYLMLPEASFEAAFKHVATIFASSLLIGGYVTAVTPAGPALGLEEKGLEGTELLQAIKPVLDLERSPIAGPVIGMYAERGYPQRLHPLMASFVQNLTDIPVLRVPAANDPFENDNFLLEMEKIGTEGGPKDINEILGADYVRTVQELNSKDIDPNDLATIREERFYLPPGGYSIAFENTLGEINKEMLAKSRSPAERAESGELMDMGNILFTLRNLTGFELSSVSASRTAQQEEPVFYTKSKQPF